MIDNNNNNNNNFRSIELPEKLTPVGTVVQATSSLHSSQQGTGPIADTNGGRTSKEELSEGALDMMDVYYDKTYSERVRKVSTGMILLFFFVKIIQLWKFKTIHVCICNNFVMLACSCTCILIHSSEVSSHTCLSLLDQPVSGIHWFQRRAADDD